MGHFGRISTYIYLFHRTLRHLNVLIRGHTFTEEKIWTYLGVKLGGLEPVRGLVKPPRGTVALTFAQNLLIKS